MLYEFADELIETDFNKLSQDKLYAGMITLKQLKEYNHLLGFSESTISECEQTSKSLRSCIDIYNDYSFGIINIINVGDISAARDKLALYIKSNLLLLVAIKDDDKSCSEIFGYAINRFKPESVTLEKLVYGFLERLIYKDNMALEQLEFELSEMEQEMMANEAEKGFNNEILFKKKKLLFLHNYYEQLIDIGEALIENENDIFTDDTLRYLNLFTTKAGRLSHNVQTLKEEVVQLREAYQAYMDYSLNSIMKMFTVVTTIFLPLTLIVGWYGMNFTHMPELTWKYGYLAVIILSIAVIAGCIWIFKKKKLM